MSDFSNIWLPFAERFYKVAFYLLESGSEAEDAVQELYLKLWSARSSLDEVRNPFAYGQKVLQAVVPFPKVLHFEPYVSLPCLYRYSSAWRFRMQPDSECPPGCFAPPIASDTAPARHLPRPPRTQEDSRPRDRTCPTTGSIFD